jgi:hypothetical protein
MNTDKVPRRKALKEEFRLSEEMETIALPNAQSVRPYAAQLEAAMKSEDRRKVEIACNAIASAIAKSFDTKVPKVRVLGARPLEEHEDSFDETYGDYDFATAEIRLWMRTAKLEKMTSFGTLLSTLCHELCHHLDVVKFGLSHTYHTRGFYERAGKLYHHVRGTPVRELVWDDLGDGSFRINWPQTMKKQPVES